MEKLISNPLKEGENIGFSFCFYFNISDNIFFKNTSTNYKLKIFIYYAKTVK